MQAGSQLGEHTTSESANIRAPSVFPNESGHLSIGFTVLHLLRHLVSGWFALSSCSRCWKPRCPSTTRVVNATVLRHMDEKWRQRFLLWGILIAVFGMRIVFPLAIVGVGAVRISAFPY